MYNGGRYYEKGVDLKIAVDIVLDSIEQRVEKIYLVSSDTDLLPAIDVARSKGVKVIYVGIENSLSRALLGKSSGKMILSKKQLKQFIT